jgi:hypothetical protein
MADTMSTGHRCGLRFSLKGVHSAFGHFKRNSHRFVPQHRNFGNLLDRIGKGRGFGKRGFGLLERHPANCLTQPLAIKNEWMARSGSCGSRVERYCARPRPRPWAIALIKALLPVPDPTKEVLGPHSVARSDQAPEWRANCCTRICPRSLPFQENACLMAISLRCDRMPFPPRPGSRFEIVYLP